MDIITVVLLELSAALVGLANPKPSTLRAAPSNSAAGKVGNVCVPTRPALPARPRRTTRQPVADSAFLAQAAPIVVPGLAVFQHAAKQLTQFQQKVLLWLGLVTLGPTDTVGDSECMYRALSQQLRMVMPEYGTSWALQHSEQAQDGFQGLRNEAAAEIGSNAWLQQYLINDSNFLLGNSGPHPYRADILKKDMMNKTPLALPGVLAARVRSPIARGKFAVLAEVMAWLLQSRLACINMPN